MFCFCVLFFLKCLKFVVHIISVGLSFSLHFKTLFLQISFPHLSSFIDSIYTYVMAHKLTHSSLMLCLLFYNEYYIPCGYFLLLCLQIHKSFPLFIQSSIPFSVFFHLTYCYFNLWKFNFF